MDWYRIIFSFVVYSILGWFVESCYMSLCNRKLTNRGFAKSPFCPIYGFGAVMGLFILSLFEGHYIKLYLCSAVMATLFEFLVGKVMLRLFGMLWWDYTQKPFNYKGIICIESTVAWGFYGIIVVKFLNDLVQMGIDRVDYRNCVIFLSII